MEHARTVRHARPRAPDTAQQRASHAGAMDSITAGLERDAKIIRALLLVRGSLARVDGAVAVLAGEGTTTRIDMQAERAALSAALKVLAVNPEEAEKGNAGGTPA
jgi:hypothetical protein